jgi:nucleoside-diphosphate-sugar epimerase
MRDLLIGSTSQLAHYWPRENTHIISSRDIDLEELKKEQWNRIYFAFSDGRTWKTAPEHDADFQEANVAQPLRLIDELHDSCNNIVFYSTAELWNHHNGALKLEQWLDSSRPELSFLWFDFLTTPYVRSKEAITERILSRQQEGNYQNVILLFPYAFSAPMRKEQGFLFSKVFDSIVNEKHIEIGDTYHYRELLHPKFVVRQSLAATHHQIIGSGRLIFVNDFIRDLYNAFGMEYTDFVTEDLRFSSGRGTNWLASKECLYSYKELLSDTVVDLWLAKGY